ncbi:YgfZ/GcvT domain-containing protein [Serinibacter salmoneus]|uniref:Aminomethyltransferase C-terminal domain-containing protein n=1 Tax=Serinibacter salmoneus TaxID=556530 RepID=A0A2A9CXL5_9MICO|nr:glycine cleavage T C-terminal barrel domain-containing protein [Serinibacter salmoneus]PFG18876.1 hypothetical protein ATL40_0426 [Serinibacter salmoneus]
MSAVLGRSGAVAATAPDGGVAAHYGDPMREQRALVRGAAVVDLSHLGVLAVTGRDRLTWLDTLSSQWLRDLAPGVGAELLLLDPNGRVEHAAALLDDGETTLLVTESGRAEPLAQFLDSMRFMLDVQVTVREDVAVLGTIAAGDGAALAVLAAPDPPVQVHGIWRDPWPGVVPGGTRYALLPDDATHPGRQTPGALVLLPADALEDAVAAVERAGGAIAGTMAWEALRIAAWRPRLAREVDHRSLPHELDWLRTAVHLNKGCYRGQEGVARTFSTGRPPRRLVMLHLDGSEHLIPEAGADVALGEKVVGRVTSVARHHELGPIALAVLKRSTDAAAEVQVAGPGGAIAASQEVIVSPDGLGEGRPQPRGPLAGGLRRRTL